MLFALGHFCGSAVAHAEEPEKVTACELSRNAGRYNHKLIEVTAFVSQGFEDFTLVDPTCPDWPSVWLEYGGKLASGTMYCCGVTAARSRAEPLAVEGIAVPILQDEQLREFDQRIRGPHYAIVRATLVGRFFAGKQESNREMGTWWSGYGHMGCCSLLVIQQVVSVDPARKDLDSNPHASPPSIREVGCGYRFLTTIQPFRGAINAQRKADSGLRDWSLDDPQRVARDFLSSKLRMDIAAISGLSAKDATSVRIVYEWRPRQAKVAYMVVLSRPYWLSYYAKDSGKVAWVVIGAYESFCGKGMDVERIH